MTSSWPEFEATTSTKAPEWTLRTESELHIERLESKLDRIKKRENKHGSSRQAQQSRQGPEIQQDPSIDLDADETQTGQGEADEGLWLLWNDSRPVDGDSSRVITTTTTAIKHDFSGASRPSSTMASASYGARYMDSTATADSQHQSLLGQRGESSRPGADGDGERSSESDEERARYDYEDRLESAKARAKHAEDYSNNRNSRSCCGIALLCCIVS